MTDILAENLKPSADAVESAVGDETVILHLKSGTYFGLDPMGTRIWAMLKEGVNAADICQRLTSEFDVSQETVEADARRFLEELKANDILVDG
jgi:PqqD family protein of HPr-rel-A system